MQPTPRRLRARVFLVGTLLLAIICAIASGLVLAVSMPGDGLMTPAGIGGFRKAISSLEQTLEPEQGAPAALPSWLPAKKLMRADDDRVMSVRIGTWMQPGMLNQSASLDIETPSQKRRMLHNARRAIYGFPVPCISAVDWNDFRDTTGKFQTTGLVLQLRSNHLLVRVPITLWWPGLVANVLLWWGALALLVRAIILAVQFRLHRHTCAPQLAARPCSECGLQLRRPHPSRLLALLRLPTLRECAVAAIISLCITLVLGFVAANIPEAPGRRHAFPPMKLYGRPSVIPESRVSESSARNTNTRENNKYTRSYERSFATSVIRFRAELSKNPFTTGGYYYTITRAGFPMPWLRHDQANEFVFVDQVIDFTDTDVPARFRPGLARTGTGPGTSQLPIAQYTVPTNVEPLQLLVSWCMLGFPWLILFPIIADARRMHRLRKGLCPRCRYPYQSH